MVAEQALQLTHGDADPLGQRFAGQGLLALALHLADHPHQLLVVQVVTAGHLHTLVIQAGADAADHKLLGHLHRQRLAVFLADQAEHHRQVVLQGRSLEMPIHGIGAVEQPAEILRRAAR